MSLKSRIEAVLFLTDKPLRAQAVARIVNEDVQLVRQVILELIHEFEARQSGLEIADDDGYIIQVKDKYASIIDEFVPMELPIALVRTLSAIALKQPIAQAEIIKIRGAGAYEHVKELLERELISKKEDGRSPLLSTTKKFQEYFRLSQDAKLLRSTLRKEIEAQEVQEVQEVQETEVASLNEQMILALSANQPESSLGILADDNQDPAAISPDTPSGDSQNEDMQPPEAATLPIPASINPDTIPDNEQTAGIESTVPTSAQAFETVVNTSEISHT